MELYLFLITTATGKEHQFIIKSKNMETALDQLFGRVVEELTVLHCRQLYFPGDDVIEIMENEVEDQ